MPKNIDHTVERLYQEMRERIELTSPGRALPSFRSLMTGHRCSRQSLTRGVWRSCGKRS